METIALAGGCFWGTEHYFKQLTGVVDTEVGYANGPGDSAPAYEEVKHGLGYAETVMITYDEAVISLEELLRLFFTIVDPFSVNRQGHDIGIQYRTGIYYRDERQKETAEAAMQALEAKLGRKTAVELKPLQNFYPAETMHQDYLEKHPEGYCHLPAHRFEEARNYRSKGIR